MLEPIASMEHVTAQKNALLEVEPVLELVLEAMEFAVLVRIDIL